MKTHSKYNPDTGELVETWTHESPIFSIIVPTRKRLYGLKRLLKSFAQTTFRPENVETILVIDKDDRDTVDFIFPYALEHRNEFWIKKVIVEPGLSMGALNMAGYEVSEGRYIMLLNDDVIVQTAGWDEKVLKEFQKFPDDVCLVHVNDLTFGEKLCVFPFVTRKYCELAGGICRRDYIRYRIDDHIHHTFELMALMGKRRIVYMPEVIFEHTNFVFDAAGNRQYFLNGNILPHDAKLFDDLLPERRKLAIKLIDSMEQSSRDGHTDDLPLVGPRVLDSLTAPYEPPDTPHVTIGIVTANIMSWYAQTAISLLKKFTKNFDLMILDNNGQKPFNHARKMNQIIGACETDFLVLMDDDVFVEAGWLEGLFKCLTDRVGVVTPMHKDKFGKLSYAGIRMRPDYSGHHDHILTVPTKPRKIQTLCSAMMLIDIRKGARMFSEEYQKYFLDIDYGFMFWELGWEVVCSPHTAVTHLGGATMQQGGQEANGVWPMDHAEFVKQWMDSGDYRRLEQNQWRGVEFSE